MELNGEGNSYVAEEVWIYDRKSFEAETIDIIGSLDYHYD